MRDFLRGGAVFLAAAGLWAAGAARAVEVWPGDPHDIRDGRVGDPAAGLRIVGARGGLFSAKLVVQRAADEEFRAVAGPLRGPAGALPAAALRVRYGAPWTDVSRGAPAGNDILLDAPPAGLAVVPVWITVRVPRDAAAGRYEGEVVVEAGGAPAARVPLRLDVADWTVPAAAERRAWVEVLQSPDTLAIEYGVPPWSERHWALIDRSFELIADSGSRAVYLPLIAHTNQGNDESMVRWIAKPDGAYAHDYAILERYLDLAVRRLGPPALVGLYAWDIYLVAPAEEPRVDPESPQYAQDQARMQQLRYALKGMGPAVTVVRPDGATETVRLPPYTEPEGERLWQPVWTGVLERLRARGLGRAAMIGTSTDYQPTREQTEALHRLSGGLPWVSVTHHARWLERENSSGARALHGIADIGYTVAALGYQYTINPAVERGGALGLSALQARTIYWRFGHLNKAGMPFLRHEVEANYTGRQRGVGRIGGDFWYAVRDRRGRRQSNVAAPARHPESHWRSLNLDAYLLAPGPDGAVPTARYLVFCEGVQACEARLAIESALADPAARARVGEPAAAQAQALLDRRLLDLWRARGATPESLAKHGLMRLYREAGALIGSWDGAAGLAGFLESGWADRMGELFAAAGAVERRLRP